MMNTDIVWFHTLPNRPPVPFAQAHDLKAYRRMLGISQTEMAEMIGCCRQSISYWESQSKPIRLRFGVPNAMAKALGLCLKPPTE